MAKVPGPDDGNLFNQQGTNASMEVTNFEGGRSYQHAFGKGTPDSPWIPVTSPYLGSCVYQGRVPVFPDSVDCFPEVETGGGCPGFLNRGLRLLSWSGNAETIYLGTGTPLSAINGFPLQPGETHFVEIGFPENLCFTTATGIVGGIITGQGGRQSLIYLGT